MNSYFSKLFDIPERFMVMFELVCKTNCKKHQKIWIKQLEIMRGA